MRLIPILALGLVFFASSDAYGCSCMMPDSDPVESVRKALKRSDVVFLGKVESTQLPDSGNTHPVDFIQTTTFYVLNSWKGEESTRIITKVNVACCVCGYRFEDSETYLVFGYKRENGFYSVSTCGLSSIFERAETNIQILDDLATSK